jgi:hypothetical protein
MTGYDPSCEYDKHEDASIHEEESRDKAPSNREWFRNYVRQQKEANRAFLASVNDPGKLSPVDYDRFMQLQGFWWYGHSGY